MSIIGAKMLKHKTENNMVTTKVLNYLHRLKRKYRVQLRNFVGDFKTQRKTIERDATSFLQEMQYTLSKSLYLLILLHKLSLGSASLLHNCIHIWQSHNVAGSR